MKRLLSIIACISAFTSFAEAQVCKAPSGKKTVKIYFANGMLTSPESAAGGLANLRTHFLAKLKDAAPDVQYEWAKAYNEDEKLVDQLIEVARQKISDVATDGAMTATDYIRMASGFMEAPSWYTDFLNKASTSVDQVEYQIDADLRKQVGVYRGDIAAGKRVIVFGHSQGNFYTNEAYDLLYKGDNPISKKSFGMIAIATPSNRVADGGPYTTFNEDTIINAVRLVFKSTLPGNVAYDSFDLLRYAGEKAGKFLSNSSNPIAKAAGWVVEKVAVPATGIFTHNFSSYLSSKAAEEKIFEDAKNELSSLLASETLISSGGVSVTLDWDSAKSDVDLHVVEPGDNEIYYGNTNGIGTLDRDVSDAPGPEHYFIACNKVVEGTFLIQAKYYSGMASETARVELSAGGKSRVFSHTFSKAQTSSDEAVTIAKLIIAKDSEGNFTYDMQEASQ